MGTNIDELIEDISNNKLSSEEDSMVNSIINDLNGNQPNRQQQQQQQQQQKQHYGSSQVGGDGYPPQLTPEEKQMLMKQQMQQQAMYEQQKMQQMQQQQMQQQQMQQQMQQQQMQQQMQQQQQQKEESKKEIKEETKDSETIDGLPIQEILQKFKPSIIVFLLIIFFNLNPIDDFLRFRQYSVFYDITSEKSTILYAIIKAIMITSFYYLITYLIK